MKRVLLAVAIVLAIPSVAVAQEDVNQRDDSVDRTTIQQPQNGATVGRTFTLSGSMTPNCGVGVNIDNVLIYIPPDVREVTREQRTGSEIPPAGRSDANGNYSVRIDLNGDAVGFVIGTNVEQDPPSTYLRGVRPGTHRFLVQPAFCESTDEQGASVGVRVEDPPVAEATATPTPSPSPTPLIIIEEPAVAPSFWETLPAWAWALIGAVIGAILLGLAEWTAHAYHKRHPKKK